MSLTAKDMHKSYVKVHKKELAELTKQRDVAKADQKRAYYRHIKSREEVGVEVPQFIFQEWEHRCRETRKLERALKKKEKERRLTYAEYRKVITEFNLRIIEKILTGYTFRVPYKLGTLSIKKIKRKFDKPTINWGETKKLKDQGIDELVYFTDNWYCRWYWRKRACQVPNKIVYYFKPTRDNRTGGGAVNKLSTLLKTDEFAHHNFELL